MVVAVRRGFAYALSLAVLLALTVLTAMLLWRLDHQSDVEYGWWCHEQAALNCQGAVNAFLSGVNAARPATEGTFAFVEGVGFRYRAVPFGAFWLLRSDGFTDGRTAVAWQVIGAAWPEGPALQVDQPLAQLTIGEEAVVNGRLAVRDIGRDDKHPLYHRAEQRLFEDIDPEVLQNHLRAQFEPDWRAQLTELVPDVQWLEGGRIWDASAAGAEAGEGPEPGLTVVVLAEQALVRGDWPGRRPLLILAPGEVVFEQQVTLNRTWINALGTVRWRGGLSARELHVSAESVTVAGALDAQASSLLALPVARDSRRPAVLSLVGSGRFEGALAALPNRVGSGENRVLVQVGSRIDTVGWLWSGGDLQIQGRHDGVVIGRRWVLAKSGSTFEGRFENVQLHAGVGLWSPWLGRRDAGRVKAHWRLR